MLRRPINKDLLCHACKQDIHKAQGYRFFNGVLLHDKCFPAYVIETRRREREAKEALNYMHEG